MQNSKDNLFPSKEELKTFSRKDLVKLVLSLQEKLYDDLWEHPLSKENERMFEMTGYVIAQRDTREFALIANLGKKKAAKILKSLEEFTLERYKNLIDPCGPDLPYPELPTIEESDNA